MLTPCGSGEDWLLGPHLRPFTYQHTNTNQSREYFIIHTVLNVYNHLPKQTMCNVPGTIHLNNGHIIMAQVLTTSRRFCVLCQLFIQNLNILGVQCTHCKLFYTSAIKAASCPSLRAMRMRLNYPGQSYPEKVDQLILLQIDLSRASMKTHLTRFYNYSNV